jgi:hypothetical protein
MPHLDLCVNVVKRFAPAAQCVHVDRISEPLQPCRQLLETSSVFPSSRACHQSPTATDHVDPLHDDARVLIYGLLSKQELNSCSGTKGGAFNEQSGRCIARQDSAPESVLGLRQSSFSDNLQVIPPPPVSHLSNNSPCDSEHVVSDTAASVLASQMQAFSQHVGDFKPAANLSADYQRKMTDSTSSCQEQVATGQVNTSQFPAQHEKTCNVENPAIDSNLPIFTVVRLHRLRPPPLPPPPSSLLPPPSSFFLVMF